MKKELHNAWRDLCEEFTIKNNQLKLPNLLPHCEAIKSSAITLITHAPVGRLKQILSQVVHWHGPVSTAIHLANTSDVTSLLKFVETNEVHLAKTNFHAFLECTSLSSSPEYTYNILHNILLEELELDYFLAMDAGFITENCCYEKLMPVIHGNPKIKCTLDTKDFARSSFF
jgi:hypothetical protein